MKHNGPWLSALTAASAGVLVAMASASAALPPVAMADSVEQPNILLINLDDLRGAGTLPVMPRVRAYFQDSGRTYTENYVSTPLCSPSRASLFTGRFPHNNGVTGNGLDAEIAALDQSATFQSYLQEDGYNTAMAGKYMNTVPLSRSPQYWDRWLFTTGGYSDINYNDDGTVHRLPGYYTDVLGDHVVEYLNDFERSDDQPWLIYVAPQAPHAPTTPSDPYTSATVPAWDYPGNFNEADIADKPSSVRWRGLLDPTVVEQTRKQQLRTLMSVDDLVGQITDEMARLGEDERTLAIFTSDNGYQWGEHRLDSKRFPYTDGVSVPLLVRWPGHIAPGSVDSRLVSNVDVLPTLLQASGVSPQLKYPLDGVSFLSDTRRSDLLLEYGRSLDSPLAPWASIRTESEQFTEWYNATTGALTEREYYNLSTDPLQLVNLLRDGTAANDPDVDSWSARLANLRQCAGNDCLVVDSEVNSPPTAQMAVPSCTALACDFSATGSSDRDGLIVDYRWEFGDGGTAQGATTTHTYAASGTYPVKVTVTDDDGATASASRSVSVSDSDSTSALDFRAGTSATNNTKRLVVTVPPSARAGDALLLFVSANRNNVTPTVPTGWTRLDHVMDSTMQSDVWWRVANSSDAGASVPITANLITKMDAQLLAYSGTRSPPVLVHSAAVEPGYTAAHRTPTVSVPSTGAWLVSYWADKSSAGSGWSEPAGTVRRLQSVGTGSGRITSLSTDSGSPVPIGTSGGLTATSSTSSDMATMWTIALTPGVSSTPAREFVDEAVRAGIYEVNESWEAEPVDFDSDGDMDLWIGFHDQGGKLWSNDGDGTFSRIATSAWPKVNAAGRIPDRHDCAWADVDQDGRIDAYCTAGRGSNNPVKYDRENELWLQLAPGTFTEVGQQWGVGELCGRSHYAAFLDANGDAYPDLYVGNAPPRDDPSDPCDDPKNELPTEESKLFLNEAGEALVPSTTLGIEGYGGVRCAEVVDYDGDGWDDLLLCGTPATYLYRNLGGTGFQNVAPSQGFGGVVTDGAMGDLDDDGDLDLVTIVWSQLAYRLNTGGVLGPAVQISSFASGGGRAVDLGDADGDGDLDVYAVLANASLGTNPNDVLFLNDELDFTPMTAPDTAGVGDAVTAMDANQDGTAEFVVLNGLEGVGPVQVLRLASD
jgi:arylsulfatase A-like enzyme/PKD repeat protein